MNRIVERFGLPTPTREVLMEIRYEAESFLLHGPDTAHPDSRLGVAPLRARSCPASTPDDHWNYGPSWRLDVERYYMCADRRRLDTGPFGVPVLGPDVMRPIGERSGLR